MSTGPRARGGQRHLGRVGGEGAQPGRGVDGGLRGGEGFGRLAIELGSGPASGVAAPAGPYADTLLVTFGVQAGITVVLLPSFQAVLGWSALLSSVAMLPMAVALIVASGVAPRLAAQIGVRRTLAIGIALAGVGLALMALFVSVDGGYLSVLAGLLALGFGSGLAITPSTEAITSSLPREKQGVASALNDVTCEFGTALGVALLGALLSAGYHSSIDGKLQGIPQGTADTARDGIANALEAAPSAGPRAQDLVHTAQQSFVD